MRLEKQGKQVDVRNLQPGQEYYYTQVGQIPIKFTFNPNDRNADGSVNISGINTYDGRAVEEVISDDVGKVYSFNVPEPAKPKAAGRRRSKKTRKTRKTRRGSKYISR